MHGVTASSSRFTIIHIIYPLFFLGGGGVSCTVRHDRCGASHCSRRSCGVIDTSFRSSCSRFSVSWAQRSSLDSAFSPAFFFLLFEWTCTSSWRGLSDILCQLGSPAIVPPGVFYLEFSLRGVKGGNLPVGRTHARNPTSSPILAL